MKKYLHGHVSEKTAYEVEDYPWGFRLRTKQRYWIESQDKKNGGERLVIQTLNPKTDRWCNPKKTTYSAVMIMKLNDKGHVCTESISLYGMGDEWKENTDKFIERHKDQLTDFQKEQIKVLYAQNEIVKLIKWEVKPSSIGPVNLLSNDPEEIRKRELMMAENKENKRMQEKEIRKIDHAINQTYNKIELFN